MKSLDKFIAEIDADDTIGNDDEIAALYEQIRLRDEAIAQLWNGLADRIIDDSPRFNDEDSMTIIGRHRILSKYLAFMEEICGIDTDDEDEPELEEDTDDEITCEDCLAWASETTSVGHLEDCKYWPRKVQ